MILGIIVFIFCSLGIIGFYNGNLIFTYIGLVLHIIENIIGIYTGESKSFGMLWISFLIAIGGTFAGNNFFEMIAICTCFENVICFILGILMLIFFYLTGNKVNEEKQQYIENIEYEENFFNELKRKNEEYEKEKNESK